MGALAVCSLFVLLVGLAAGLVSIATTSWVDPGIGLMQYCSPSENGCTITIGDDVISLIVLAFILFGSMLCLPAVLIVFTSISSETRNKHLASGCLLFIASIFIIGGVATYTITKSQVVGTSPLFAKFGFSFILAWISGIATLLAAITSSTAAHKFMKRRSSKIRK